MNTRASDSFLSYIKVQLKNEIDRYRENVNAVFPFFIFYIGYNISNIFT